MDAVNNTILVIEDDPGLNELLCEKIQESGYSTYSVLSAGEAINWLRNNIPLLLVIDYSLSDMTATDFINQTNSKGVHLPPFIVATGQGNERIAVEMMKLGARDYIIKDTNLLEMLPNIIGRVAKEIRNEFKLMLAEKELKESEAKLKMLLIESSFLIDNSNTIDYQKITDTIYEISTAKYVSFDVIHKNDNTIQTCALSGIRENILKISSMLGFEIVNKRWNLTQSNAGLIEKSIVTRFESLTDITSSQMPRAISKLIEKSFDLGEVIIVKITQNGETIGFFSMFFAKGNTLSNTDLIELYANHVGLYIIRKKAEAALIKKVNELENMNRFMINREVKMSELKKEINDLLESMGKEKKYF